MKTIWFHESKIASISQQTLRRNILMISFGSHGMITVAVASVYQLPSSNFIWEMIFSSPNRGKADR